MLNIPSASSLACLYVVCYEICRNWYMFSRHECSVIGLTKIGLEAYSGHCVNKFCVWMCENEFVNV